MCEEIGYRAAQQKSDDSSVDVVMQKKIELCFVGVNDGVHGGGTSWDLLLAHAGQPLTIQAYPSLLESPKKGPDEGHQRELRGRHRQPAMRLTRIFSYGGFHWRHQRPGELGPASSNDFVRSSQANATMT